MGNYIYLSFEIKMKFCAVVLLAVAFAEEAAEAVADAAEEVEEVEEVAAPATSAIQTVAIQAENESVTQGNVSWWTQVEDDKSWAYFECDSVRYNVAGGDKSVTCMSVFSNGTNVDGCNVTLTAKTTGRLGAGVNASIKDWWGTSLEDIAEDADNNNCELVEEEGWNTVAVGADKKLQGKFKWRRQLDTGDAEDLVWAVSDAEAEEKENPYANTVGMKREGAKTFDFVKTHENQIFLSGASKLVLGAVSASVAALLY